MQLHTTALGSTLSTTKHSDIKSIAEDVAFQMLTYLCKGKSELTVTKTQSGDEIILEKLD